MHDYTNSQLPYQREQIMARLGEFSMSGLSAAQNNNEEQSLEDRLANIRKGLNFDYDQIESRPMQV